MNARSNRVTLETTFWVGVCLYAAYSLIKCEATPIVVLLASAAVSVCALAPSYLWCTGRAPGLPIFPVMALTYIWTFAIPLTTQQRQVVVYSTSEQVQAAFTAVLFLLIATVIWFLVVRVRSKPPSVIIALPENLGSAYFLYALAFTCMFQVFLQANWIFISGEFIGIFRAGNQTFSTLAVIILSYRWGRRQLEFNAGILFLIVLVTCLLVSISSLLLVGAMTMVFAAVTAFTLGRGQPPVTAIIVALTFFAFLHLGKGSVRQTYWSDKGALQPIEYPVLFVSWIGESASALPKVFQSDGQSSSIATLDQRSSLVQMTMLVQNKTREGTPFLFGQTYSIIPWLLVPRFIDPNKARTHEGTYILAITFGIQTYEDTIRTTVGFGLLAESYANFGYVGVIGLAIVIGMACGAATRLGMNVPLTSLRGFVTLLILTSAIQTEFSASVLVTSLFQSIVVVLIGSFALMRELKSPKYNVDYAIERQFVQ